MSIPPDFDELYRLSDDPWDTESAWYEQRKLAVLLAALPREHYRSVWEPGCGPGVTSRALACRTDELHATDCSIVALGHAERRCRDLPNVRFEQLELPAAPARSPVELVVVAEFLYYVADLEAGLETLWSQLEPRGQIAFLHWRHRPHDAFRSGEEMHEDVRDFAERRESLQVVGYIEPDFRIDVFEARREHS